MMAGWRDRIVPAAAPMAEAPPAEEVAPTSQSEGWRSRIKPATTESKKAAGIEAPTIQEMHPDFGMIDRMVTGGLLDNTQDRVNYLQKKHPNLEISTGGPNDQIRARARNSEGPYHVLDPDKFDVYDIADHAADAVKVGGTVGAGMIGTPLAAAATGGTLEAFRQVLGNYLAGHDDRSLNKLKVGVDAVGGGAARLIGGGGRAAQVVEPYVAKAFAPQAIESALLDEGGQGAAQQMAKMAANAEGQAAIDATNKAGAELAAGKAADAAAFNSANSGLPLSAWLSAAGGAGKAGLGKLGMFKHALPPALKYGSQAMKTAGDVGKSGPVGWLLNKAPVVAPGSIDTAWRYLDQ